MANAWEYPGLNYEQGNYDYFICQVKTFNERLETYQREVNEKLADQDEEIAAFKNTVNTQINQLRLETRQFEADLNARFADYTADQDARFVEQMRLLNARLDTINANIYNYLVENLPDIIDNMPALQDAIILNQTEQVIFTATGSGWGSGTVTCNKEIDDIMERYENNTLQIYVVWMNVRFKVLPISIKHQPYGQNGARLLLKGILVGGPGDGDTDTELATFLINYADDGAGTIATNSLSYKAMPKFIKLQKTVTISGGNTVDLDNVIIDKGKYANIEVVSFGVNWTDAEARPVKRFFPSDVSEDNQIGFDISTRIEENAPTALYDTVHTTLIFPDDYTGTVTFFATLLLF